MNAIVSCMGSFNEQQSYEIALQKNVLKSGGST